MSIRQFAIAYAASAVVFLVLDGIWLTVMADRLYRPALGHLMLERFALAPAAAFYAIYLAGVVVFAVSPALASGRWLTSLGLGALLGLMAYATYDLTNQATLKDWSWTVTIADLCWGTFVTAVSAAVAAKVVLAASR
ncbi:DUF2177 family protein [Variovorax paradoxus]|uniref:DUF2177 family protein n=1 Tax=Variovorax paradoxus TaxID=34073 RepID=A0A6I6HL74_VARPD|nr:DUF2177 family protein [Variovorax paradoxus]QGW83625.1 DUF2177 family protein [Variovorax paradoxus]